VTAIRQAQDRTSCTFATRSDRFRRATPLRDSGVEWLRGCERSCCRNEAPRSLEEIDADLDVLSREIFEHFKFEELVRTLAERGRLARNASGGALSTACGQRSRTFHAVRYTRTSPRRLRGPAPPSVRALPSPRRPARAEAAVLPSAVRGGLGRRVRP